MKKMIALLLALAALLGCTACGQKEEAPTVELDVTEMRAICELSTMDCYYHNVAKYFEKDAQKGFLGIGKKDKRFWMEYSGVVRMGIDVSLVKVEVEDMQVTITIPEAMLMCGKVTQKNLIDNSPLFRKKAKNLIEISKIFWYNKDMNYLILPCEILMNK